MSANAASIRKHRTLLISDVHLGSPGCKARQLTEFLARNDCETLYLVGDIFDGWKLQSRFFWTPDHSRVIKAVLRKARHGTKVYYLTGNHDAFMRQFVKNRLRLGGVRLVHELIHKTADGRKFLVQHGDKYDAVIRNLPSLAFAGDIGYEMALKISDRLNRLRRRLGDTSEWSLSSFLKTTVKGMVQYLSGFDEAVYYQCRRRNLNGVITGHTHHAEARHIRNGIISYNCGDWVESCTALGEDFNGRITILHADPRPAISEPEVLPIRHPLPIPPRLAENPRVAGSIPALATISNRSIPVTSFYTGDMGNTFASTRITA